MAAMAGMKGTMIGMAGMTRIVRYQSPVPDLDVTIQHKRWKQEKQEVK